MCLKCEKTKEQMPTATKQPLPQSDAFSSETFI